MFEYPSREDLQAFVQIISERKYRVSRYLPTVNEEWFDVVYDCIAYVQSTADYETEQGFHDCCARLLYKIVKRHELGDGNKRSAVIAVFLFCLLNDYTVREPRILKEQARRVARTRGRTNEALLRTRVAQVLTTEIQSDF